MKLLVAAVVIAVIAACRQSASSSAADSSAVITASAQYRQAWLQSDTAMALGVVSTDARYMIPGVPDIVGEDNLRKLFVSEMAAWRIPTLNVNRQELIVRGDHAIDIGTYEETMVPKSGAPVHGAGRYVIVWRREQGDWRIFRFIVNNQDTTVANRPS